MHATTPLSAQAALTLSQIAPKRSAAFSPNLYRWMKHKAHWYTNGGVLHTVYRVQPGTRTAKDCGEDALFLGYMDGRNFIGVRLMAALCQGTKAGSACYLGMGQDLCVVENFWKQYLAVGRCAIDPGHREYFMADRYAVVDGQKTCRWCGKSTHQAMEGL